MGQSEYFHAIPRFKFALVCGCIFSLSACSPTVYFSPLSTPNLTITPPAASSPSPVALPSPVVPTGLLDGHFDVDTATQGEPFPISSGTVTYHVHEYDKVNQTTTVDFFNLSTNQGSAISGNTFDLIQSSFSGNQRFYLIVVNSTLNPGGVLEINGSTVLVTTYQSTIQSLIASKVMPTAYTILSPQKAGDQQLTSLKIGFDPNVPAVSLLIPTAPNDCVFPNIPGKNGEYRDGALVIQAIDANNLNLDSNTGAEVPNAGLLWEGIIYNHYMITKNGQEVDPEDCYSATFY